MADLARLKQEASTLESAFDLACVKHGYADRWEAYRAAALSDDAWPKSLRDINDAWTAALLDFYSLRDGPNGFLGGRGL